MTKHARLPATLRPSAADAPHASRFQHRYYAFLSYSHKDREYADWLHSELEAFRVPRALQGRITANGILPKRLAPVFRDRHELAAAHDLNDEIRAALAWSQFLIVLCSPEAAQSHWTNAEIEAFKRDRPEGCVLAAIVAGEPFASEIPGREQEECFPPALRQKYDRRGRPTGKRAEPLAADLREQGDGRRLGFLKLVAGMLGVGLDELVQRETTQRHRRLAWLTTASLAGMVIASGLAITAIQARDAARDQRREAEGLVAYMVGDLKDKLEPIGKLDALDGVGAKVLDYYSKQDTSALSDAGLMQRSKALSLTAQVAYLRGNYDGAERLYREALAGTAEAIRRDRGDPKRLFDHAQNVFWEGELARRRGDTGRAEAAYREYKRLADEMVAIEPDNLKYRMEVQYAREDIGIVLVSQRRYDEAAQQFAAGIAPMESLAAIDSTNLEYQKELSNILAWLADAQRAQGRLDDAIDTRKRQLSFLNRILASGRLDVALQEQNVPAHQGLGILLVSRGATQPGVQELQTAVDEADRLITIEPTNTVWRTLVASAKLELAKTLLSTDQGERAAQQTAAGCGTVEQILTHDPTSSRARTLRSDCLAMRSRMAATHGDNSGAEAFARRAVASAQSERSGDPILDRYRVAAAYRLLGDACRRGGDRNEASAAWKAGLQNLPVGVTERPMEMYERASLLERVDRAGEARPLFSRLAAIGYRSII